MTEYHLTYTLGLERNFMVCFNKKSADFYERKYTKQGYKVEVLEVKRESEKKFK